MAAGFWESGRGVPSRATRFSHRTFLYPPCLLSLPDVCGGSLVAKSCPTIATPWIIAFQALLSMELSRQECWSGLPFPSSGDLPDPGIKLESPVSPAFQVDTLLLSHLGKMWQYWVHILRQQVGGAGVLRLL